ncbi:MAG: HEAT repeat domain-containing protein [Acidobacteriota bacterium]
MNSIALKPDSSFFRKIAMGAVGTRTVCSDLAHRGHELVELERGSLDTKLWKDVKRKRVRIPDLVCCRCGIRVESRAKTKAELSVSHSITDASRAWDFGMVDSDWIAFPVCESIGERYWSNGRLGPESSYWHERNWVQWQTKPWINYFSVRTFRSTPHTKSVTKGVTEGSETSIGWEAVFSRRTGVVAALEDRRITVERAGDGHRHTRTIPAGLVIRVDKGQAVAEGQLVASKVCPLAAAELECARVLSPSHISNLLASRERTQRFTGVKLARVRREASFCDAAAQLADDDEEGVYIRLEAVAYLASVCGRPVGKLFAKYLASADDQTRLESVISLGETSTPDAVGLLSGLLDDRDQPYFLRSAAAWGLGRAASQQATNRLIRAFADVDRSIREEALEGLVSIGGPAVPLLLTGLGEVSAGVAAGCAEALRQQGALPASAASDIIAGLSEESNSQWRVWLLGQLPREQVAPLIASLHTTAPALHYAVTLLWTFIESWIARRWELSPGPRFPASDSVHDV